MRFKLPEIPPSQLLAALRGYNLLPAIIFLPTRRRCDESAQETTQKSARSNDEKAEKRREIFDAYVAENPEIKSHKHKNALIRAGVAAHHAGHIPAWKLLIEKMMSAGLLEAIFATSTVAAGVDFPARTVVLSFADTRGNDGWRQLEASELQQMTGRAGRRGKDNVGFVILAPSNFQNPPRIAQLLKSPPDALQSRFRATYSSLLNLLDAYKSFAQVREIAEKSFAFRDTAAQIARLERKRENRIAIIESKISASGFSLDLEDVRGFRILTNARNHLQENIPNLKTELRRKWLKENVLEGRIVTQGRSSKTFYMVLDVYGEKVTAMKDNGGGTSFPLARVNQVYQNIYPLKDTSVEQAFYDIYEGRNPPLKEPPYKVEQSKTDEAVEILDAAIEKIFPADLSETQKMQMTGLLWEVWQDADFLDKTERDAEFLRNEVWLPFENRAKVLHHFGYLDFSSQTVTERGKWLADLRVDRPLLTGEALRHGLFDGLEIPQVAALMAALAADSERNYGEIYLSEKILEVLTQFESIIFNVSNVEWKNGVEPAPEMNFSAAAAAEAWAGGMSWDELIHETKAEEGDLVRLLSRTGEALMQIANLRQSNPQAAEIAYQTAEIVLREPIR